MMEFQTAVGKAVVTHERLQDTRCAAIFYQEDEGDLAYVDGTDKAVDYCTALAALTEQVPH